MLHHSWSTNIMQALDTTEYRTMIKAKEDMTPNV